MLTHFGCRTKSGSSVLNQLEAAEGALADKTTMGNYINQVSATL